MARIGRSNRGHEKDGVGYAVQLVQATEDIHVGERDGDELCIPDGEWMLYTISTPDWQEAESQSDIYLVSMTEGLASTRQMTFTEGFNETAPQWGRDGNFFVFLSDREASGRGDRGERGD